MSGLFGDPWNPGKTVEPDLLRLGAGDPTPPSDQDLTDAATVAYVQAYVAGVMAGFQPLDSDLTAIAALSTTSFGRALLALADAAALRSTAGLVIGTDVQAHDTDLDAIARSRLKDWWRAIAEVRPYSTARFWIFLLDRSAACN